MATQAAARRRYRRLSWRVEIPQAFGHVYGAEFPPPPADCAYLPSGLGYVAAERARGRMLLDNQTATRDLAATAPRLRTRRPRWGAQGKERAGAATRLLLAK